MNLLGIFQYFISNVHVMIGTLLFFIALLGTVANFVFWLTMKKRPKWVRIVTVAGNIIMYVIAITNIAMTGAWWALAYASGIFIVIIILLGLRLLHEMMTMGSKVGGG